MLSDEDWIELDGAWVENTKRRAWAPFLALPERTRGVGLELALGGLTRGPELRTLREHGWSTRDAWSVAGDARAFRAYVAGSRGEFDAGDGVLRFRDIAQAA